MSNVYFDPLIQRICQAAKLKLRNSDDGCVIVTIKVLMDAHNKPIFWTEPDCIKLEPAKKAAAFLVAMGE